MKWIAISLLTGNVVFFAWQFNEQLRAHTIAAAKVQSIPVGTPGLSLISELPELPPQREPSNTQGEQVTDLNAEVSGEVDLHTETNRDLAASNVCVNIGPVTDKEKLDILRAWLRERSTSVTTRVETVSERRFFCVYLEPATDDEARRNLSDLQRRGVTDYLYIQRSGLKNAISLGLFRSQDSVNRRLAEMGKQGYKPIVVPKFEKNRTLLG
jgi:hypothetical protein